MKQKNNNKELVAEIHEAFYHEVDVLRKYAEVLTPLPTPTPVDDRLLYKADKLKSLGFSNSKVVKLSTEEQRKIDKIKCENEVKNDIINTINYFSNKYKNYTFIPEESVIKLCKKYNLMCSYSINYIGDVPDYNLKCIENINIDEKDEVWARSKYLGGGDTHRIEISSDEAKEVIEDMAYDLGVYNKLEYCEPYKAGLEIIAPLSYFDTAHINIDKLDLNYEINIVYAPILLCPVYYNDTKHYLIINAWC